MEVSTTIPDEWYWKFREKAAANQNTEEEELRELIADYLEEDLDTDEIEVDQDFEEFVRQYFGLEKGKRKTQNVVAVVTEMKQGRSWNDAVNYLADKAQRERGVKDEYDKTIRSQCTRELGYSTEEFKEEVRDLISEFGDSHSIDLYR